MATSFSTITPGSFELTPCRVTFKGVDLGGTDKVMVKIEEKQAPLKADQLGDSIIDKKISGYIISVETALDEVLMKTNWQVVFPADALVTENGNESFYFSSQIGQSLRALAGMLTLHPLSKVNSDHSSDFNFYLAAAQPNSQLEYSSQDQQKLKVVFDIYPDFTTQPARWMLYGDLAVGLVNATAGAATAATGNVGNGTVSGITVNNGATKTELVTLQCVTPGASAVFFVAGSVTGPMGLATTGLSFTAPGDEIGFTINAGGTNFATNDSFTIATTSANYT